MEDKELKKIIERLGVDKVFKIDFVSDNIITYKNVVDKIEYEVGEGGELEMVDGFVTYKIDVFVNSSDFMEFETLEDLFNKYVYEVTRNVNNGIHSTSETLFNKTWMEYKEAYEGLVDISLLDVIDIIGLDNLIDKLVNYKIKLNKK